MERLTITLDIPSISASCCTYQCLDTTTLGTRYSTVGLIASNG